VSAGTAGGRGRREAAAVFAAVFLLYLACLYPAIAPRDSADLIAAAMTLGVAHPPGYPLYALLGRAWLAVLPWGNAAYRMNLLSALAGAAAAAVLFLLVRRRAGTPGGLAAAALWALSAPLWKFSLLGEMYSLHALFAVSLLALAEGEAASVFRRARLSGFLLGLGLVDHQTLLLWAPAVLLLWRAEAARAGVRPGRLAAAATGPLAAGLSLYAFLWVRLGGLAPALETALRSRYGTGTLFAGLSLPLSAASAAALLGLAAAETVRAVTWPAFAAALAGAALAWRADRARAGAWLLGAALAGPGFVVLSRLDPANWVARTALEPAFLLPALVAAALAGEAVGALSRRAGAGAAAAAALVLSGAAVFLRTPLPEHRDDFLAYDYARDLRRAVPPGGALLTSGDTASYALRWLALTDPGPVPRRITPALASDARAWVDAHAGRPDAFVSGLGPAFLESLGLPSRARPLSPEGLVQRLGALPPTPRPLSVLRRPRAWARDESYARDERLAYAFSHWLTARLIEAEGGSPDAAEVEDLRAAATDPRDYRLR
jgi:hypothetical protein